MFISSVIGCVYHPLLVMSDVMEVVGNSYQTLQVLLAIAHEQSLDRILRKLTNPGLEHLASVQVWLTDNGDHCSTCPHRLRCPDHARCLHLAAGGEGLFPGSVPEKVRLPLGFGAIGKVATTGRQVILRNLDQQPELIAEIGMKPQPDILVFNGSPISFKGEVLGVIAAFIRGTPPGEMLHWGQVFADHVGGAVANARAFEEIRHLKAQLELQNSYLQEEVVEAKAFGDLIGQSAALKQINSQIDLVAPTEASVLVLGETGTGKELVAREIHRRSQRQNGPLVRVNCASIPRDLFESEFFGHTRGAFTGAVSDRAGRFETAEGGTLFLDEVGEIPLEMQGKLLRVLQERKYERLGEDRTRNADVRIIGATNRDLVKAVAAGRFREDLYYRLHVFPIQVIPLRQRKDDLPLLAQHFVDLSVKELKCSRPRLTKAAITSLQAYHWPGNVRELRNVIERAVILAQGGPLRFDLPIATPSVAVAAPIQEKKTAPAFYTETEMRQREGENLMAVLRQANGRVKGKDGAAELLGVHPATFFSRMRKLGLRSLPGNNP
jgi:transcriptional regulator with GAF, ATPase, and Fis domain